MRDNELFKITMMDAYFPFVRSEASGFLFIFMSVYFGTAEMFGFLQLLIIYNYYNLVLIIIFP